MDKFCEDCIHNEVCQYYAIPPHKDRCNDKDTLDDLIPQGECKNCKHFKESLCENSPYGWCSIRRATQEGDLETQVPKDYYCSWYEKGDTK